MAQGGFQKTFDNALEIHLENLVKFEYNLVLNNYMHLYAAVTQSAIGPQKFQLFSKMSVKSFSIHPIPNNLKNSNQSTFQKSMR